MREISETELPGVGIRFDVRTDGGRGVGVVAHRSGRRDLVIYDERDPDRAAESVELTQDEGHTLGELLGGSPVVEHLEDAVQRTDDLEISWVPIHERSAVVGQSLAEMQLRARTGAGVVGVLTESGSIPVPGGDQVLQAGNTAIVVGLPEAVEAATALLSSGEPGERAR